MRFIVLSGNPKETGLCRAMTDAALAGAKEGGAEAIEAGTEDILRCQICGDGWGTCRAEHACVLKSDRFEALTQLLRSADAVALVTPVYWGECAEGLKSFMDRLRRCENRMTRPEGKGLLSGKPLLLIASAGGSGGGISSCLSQMERFCQHTDARIFDMIGVNRWNSDYKRAAIHAAARAIAGGRKHGDTV